MFSLIIKQVFIVSLNFNISLTTTCLSLSDEPCMVRATLIDLSPIELKHSSLMVSQDIRSGSCNSGNDLSTKMCVPSETEDRNVNAFNIIANKNEAKAHIHVILNLNYQIYKFCVAQKAIYSWDVKIDNIVISMLIKIKTNSKYLIGYLGKVIRTLVLMFPKLSEYVKTFKVKDGGKDKTNKSMSFGLNDE